MTHIDDETLAAFADGELEAEKMAAVRDALSRDPQLRVRLDELKDLDNLLRASVAADADLPDRFASLLKPTAEVVQFASKRRSQNWLPIAGSAIAAAVAALMFGNVLLPAQTGWLRHVDDGVALAGVVEEATITTASGELVKSGDLNIRPIMSFVANDGRACREIHLRDKEMAGRIVACRDTDEDEWCIEAFASMPINDFPDNYHTAGVKKDPVIDAAFARLGVKETMDEKTEKAAIAKGWAAR